MLATAKRFNKNTILIILLCLLLCACSSNRFIRWQIQDNNNALLPALTSQQIDSLSTLQEKHRNTLQQICTNQTLAQNLIYRVAACQQLLEASAKSLSTALIQTYNDALFELLSAAPIQQLMQHSNLQFKLDQDRLGQPFSQFYFTRQMQAKEAWLQPEIFPGIGITASAYRPNSYNIDDESYPLEGIYRPVTFYVEQLQQKDESFTLVIKAKRMQANDRQFKADLSLAYAPGAAFLTLLNNANIDEVSMTGLLKAERAEHRFGIFALQEFATDKTPILMIHGLNSSPLIWRKMTMAIMNNEQLNRRYQVWHAFYPSGPPPFYNAMRLRSKVAMLMGRFAKSDVPAQGINVIGHSMGGIIAKTFAIDTEDKLWNAVFSKSPEDMAQALHQNPGMQDIFIFAPVAKVQQLFFLDTPHRGSEMASSWIGRLGAGLINLPKQFTNMFANLIEQFGVEVITPPMRPFLATHGPNSIEVLRPNHPMMNVINQLQLPVKTWSIVGSNGALSCSEDECKQLSDGVVSFESASMDGIAQEEVIVSSEHDSFNNDDAIDFVLRKLASEE